MCLLIIYAPNAFPWFVRFFPSAPLFGFALADRTSDLRSVAGSRACRRVRPIVFQSNEPSSAIRHFMKSCARNNLLSLFPLVVFRVPAP